MADFALQEADLYLDGHPRNQKALEYFRKYQQMAHAARCAYEDEFGPLTYYHAAKEDYWDWVVGPWPWECEV